MNHEHRVMKDSKIKAVYFKTERTNISLVLVDDDKAVYRLFWPQRLDMVYFARFQQNTQVSPLILIYILLFRV